MSEGPPTGRLATLLGRFHPEQAAAHSDATRDPSISTADEISIGEILDTTQHAGFGFVAALLALASIPLVGLTVPFGLAIAGIGVQMIAGMTQPWLPAALRRRRIGRSAIQSLNRRMAPWTARMALLVRPRMQWMTSGPFWTLSGAGLVIQGLSLTLPIPGADWLFVVPTVLYGVGLLERDGILVLACHIITLIQLALFVMIWELIVRGFAEFYEWLAVTI